MTPSKAGPTIATPFFCLEVGWKGLWAHPTHCSRRERAEAMVISPFPHLLWKWDRVTMATTRSLRNKRLLEVEGTSSNLHSPSLLEKWLGRGHSHWGVAIATLSHLQKEEGEGWPMPLYPWPWHPGSWLPPSEKRRANTLVTPSQVGPSPCFSPEAV